MDCKAKYYVYCILDLVMNHASNVTSIALSASGGGIVSALHMECPCTGYCNFNAGHSCTHASVCMCCTDRPEMSCSSSQVMGSADERSWPVPPVKALKVSPYARQGGGP